MKVTERSYKVVTLELSEDEVDWLKAVTQNFPGVCETSRDADIRQSFWEALNPVRVTDERPA